MLLLKADNLKRNRFHRFQHYLSPNSFRSSLPLTFTSVPYVLFLKRFIKAIFIATCLLKLLFFSIIYIFGIFLLSDAEGNEANTSRNESDDEIVRL